MTIFAKFQSQALRRAFTFDALYLNARPTNQGAVRVADALATLNTLRFGWEIV